MKLLLVCLVSAFLASSTLQSEIRTNSNYYDDDSSTIAPGQDPNCLDYDSGKKCCSQCVFRTVNIKGKCVKVNDLCSTWCSKTADCTSCYGGYTLKNGACVIGNNNSKDPYCTQWNSDGKCISCAFRTVWRKGACKVVSDQCKTWN